ncbi:MAG: glutathione peroxidase [Saprospiraceae bacterium]|jgi:glutathione peroxidase|nr:glutathione peroxidase [Saprospiraceae bacterium]
MKKLFTLFMSLVGLASCFNQSAKQRPAGTTTPMQSTTSIYDFKMPELESGEMIDFSQYKGKKIVLLNVASKCGYTPQYADWEAFYKAHGDKVVVLGFPANNFMGQEPGSNEDIASFCSKNYGVSFPMFQKISVKGDDIHPLYKWLSDKNQNGWNSDAPSWNFCKYVVNENGELMGFFPSVVKPDDAEFKKAVGI